MDNPGIPSASSAEAGTRSGQPFSNVSTPNAATKIDCDHVISAATSSKAPTPATAEKAPVTKASQRLLNPLQVQVAQNPSRPLSVALGGQG